MEDINKLAEEYATELGWPLTSMGTKRVGKVIVNAVIHGYNLQKNEESTFTLKELEEAFNVGRLYQGREGDTDFKSFLKRLQ